MNPPKPQNSFFSQVLFILSLLFLMAVVGGFFALTYLTGKLQAQYNDINGQLTSRKRAIKNAGEHGFEL